MSEVADRRERALAVGLRAFSEQPFDAVSMDAVAAEAGVAKGLLYYYFGSKRGLYVAAVRAAAADLREQWDADPGLPPRERLENGLDAYLTYAEQRAEGYRALIAGGIGTDSEVRAILAEEREHVIATISGALGLDATRPALRVALQGWLSFMEGAALEWLAARRLDRAQVRALLLVVLDGALLAARGVDPELAGSIG